MCGIAGIVNLVAGPPDRNIVQGMLDVMRHRGPDGEGIYSDPQAALGHVRLSIIDVEGSRQPLCNEDETVWVTFNGEIYNYRELRDELRGRGHRLQTQGDTETLVHLYEDYGPQMVDRLIGMFAFAIWDKKRRQLFLVRDRLGIKPLYYYRRGEEFVFASEIKAFLNTPDHAAGEVSGTIVSLRAVSGDLVGGYHQGPAGPLTFTDRASAPGVIGYSATLEARCPGGTGPGADPERWRHAC
jgi:asparagine synthase (glutamine-hydrolysing)